MKEWLQIIADYGRWLRGSKPESAPLPLTEMQPLPSVDDPPSGDGRSKQEVFYDVMMRRLDTQANADDSLSQKAATWLSIPTLVLTFLATILVVERETLTLRDYAGVLIAFLLYVLSLVLLFFSYRPQDWADGAPWTQIAGDVGDPSVSTDDLYYNIALHIAKDTIVANDIGLLHKKKLLNTGVFIALFSVMLLLGVVLVNLPAGTEKQPTFVILVTETPTPIPTPIRSPTVMPATSIVPTPTRSG